MSARNCGRIQVLGGLRLIEGKLRYMPGGLALTRHQIMLARTAYKAGVVTLSELALWSGLSFHRISALIAPGVDKRRKRNL